MASHEPGDRAHPGVNNESARNASPLSLSLEKLSLLAETPSKTSPRHDQTNTPVSSYPTQLARPKEPSTAPRSPRPSGSQTPSEHYPSRSPSLSSQHVDTRAETARPVSPPDAPTLAAALLTQDLSSHPSSTADAVVILQDDCYGHRFSRPRTNKSALSMIVERPERLRASVLGVSAAYVRLGHRYAERMRGAAVGQETLASAPFKIHKTHRRLPLLDPAVVAVHGKEWLTELSHLATSAGAKLAHNGRELDREPTADGARAQLHDGDLYLCQESLAAFEGALGGVCEGIDAVFGPAQSGPRRAFVAIRPPGHHCAADYPSGFCWLNNVHVGIEYAAQHHGLTHAAILDFDLHHGDGSQDITWSRNARSVNLPKNTPWSRKVAIGYYSMHDINSYPCESGDQAKVQSASLCIDNAHGQSIWNVHLEPYASQAEFWELYERKYSILLSKARSFLRSITAKIRATPKTPSTTAKSAIFISAGFDASQWEGAGMQRHAVNVPTDFYARFAADVVKMAQEEDTGAGGRVISVLEGGYSDRALTSGVMSHIAGLCLSPPDSATADGLATSYNPTWWNAENLQALDSHIAPPLPATAKKTKSALGQTTYASPTASFTQKVVDPGKYARSVSGTIRTLADLHSDSPLPEISWTVATHELSKLLIPTTRTTTSCTPESLAAPRIKKEIVAPVHATAAGSDRLSFGDSPGSNGRQLRERKARVIDSGSVAKTPVTSPRKARGTKKIRADAAVPAVPIAVASVAAHSVPNLPPGAVSGGVTKAPIEATPEPPRVDAADAQLDALSSGVRKLKLKVCSKEEWDRREAEKAEAERLAKSEARKKVHGPTLRLHGLGGATSAAGRQAATTMSDHVAGSGAKQQGQVGSNGSQLLSGHPVPQSGTRPLTQTVAAHRPTSLDKSSAQVSPESGVLPGVSNAAIEFGPNHGQTDAESKMPSSQDTQSHMDDCVRVNPGPDVQNSPSKVTKPGDSFSVQSTMQPSAQSGHPHVNLSSFNSGEREVFRDNGSMVAPSGMAQSSSMPAAGSDGQPADSNMGPSLQTSRPDQAYQTTGRTLPVWSPTGSIPFSSSHGYDHAQGQR